MPLLLRRGAEGSEAGRSVLTPPGFALLSHPPQRGGLFYDKRNLLLKLAYWLICDLMQNVSIKKEI